MDYINFFGKVIAGFVGKAMQKLLTALLAVDSGIYKAQRLFILLLLTISPPRHQNHESCFRFISLCSLFLITVSLTG